MLLMMDTRGMTMEPRWEPMTLGQVVRSRRLALGLTQVQLAELLEVDQTWISAIEREYRRTLPTPDEIKRIADSLQTTLNTYGHLLPSIQRDAAGMMGRLLDGDVG